MRGHIVAFRWRLGLFLVVTASLTVLGLHGALWPNSALAGPTIPLQCPTYESTDVPKAIPDFNLTGVNSSVVISGPGLRITNVSVRLNSIVHTFVGDVRAWLIAPDATTITLIGEPGVFANDGDNFYGTTLDDKFATLILNGTAPFTGGFRPVGTLASLRGKYLAGTWQLRVADVADRDVGTLESWTLEICALPEIVWLPIIRR